MQKHEQGPGDAPDFEESCHRDLVVEVDQQFAFDAVLTATTLLSKTGLSIFTSCVK
jgi:hypothetical protein